MNQSGVFLDYVFFVYGLSFILLSLVCYFLSGEDSPGPDWKWFGLFALLHGVNEWLDMSSLVFPDPTAFSAIRTALMSVSFLALFEFGRRTLKSIGAFYPGGVIYVFLVPLAASGVFFGPAGANAACRYVLGLTGAGLAAYSVYKSALFCGHRREIYAVSALLCLYAFAAGAVVPAAGLYPARWLNYDTFQHVFGFPVQLLRALLATAMAGLAWTYSLRRKEAELSEAAVRRRNFLGRALLFSLLAVLAAGWVVVKHVGDGAMESLLNDSDHLNSILYNRMNSVLETADDATRSMAGAPWVYGSFENSSPAVISRGESVLARYCDSFGFSVCYLLNRKGTVIASTDRGMPVSLIGMNYAFRPYFKEALSGQCANYFALGVTTGKRGYYASCPVRNQAGKITGVAVIKKNMDFLASELRLFPYSFLVSPEGVIFISSKPKLVFRSLWPASNEAAQKLVASRQFGVPDFSPFLPGRVFGNGGVTLEGKKYFVSLKSFRGGDWSLITLNAMYPVQAARFSTILILLVFCFLLLAGFLIIIYVETERAAVERLLLLKEEVKTLSGILPICAGCKKIRDDKGYWNRVESYISKHTKAEFSHGLCPDCAKRLYPEYSEDKDKK